MHQEVDSLRMFLNLSLLMVFINLLVHYCFLLFLSNQIWLFVNPTQLQFGLLAFLPLPSFPCFTRAIYLPVQKISLPSTGPLWLKWSLFVSLALAFAPPALLQTLPVSPFQTKSRWLMLPSWWVYSSGSFKDQLPCRWYSSFFFSKAKLGGCWVTCMVGWCHI